MIRRRPRGETTLSKATYDDRRTQGPAPLPMRHDAALAAETAKLRRFDECRHRHGLAVALGLIEPKPAEPPLRRRI
jgi:hypothetical protein